MFAQAAALPVTADQMEQLEALVRSGSTPQRLAKKCRVVLLASQGVANHAIAQQTGRSRPTVIAIRRAFAQAGLDAIERRQKRKKPSPILTSELQQKILDTTLKTKPAGETHWSVRTLARDLGLSRTMVHRVWQRFDIQPHRANAALGKRKRRGWANFFRILPKGYLLGSIKHFTFLRRGSRQQGLHPSMVALRMAFVKHLI